MNKPVIILAIAALTTPVAVSADATVYGQIRQTIDNVDKEQIFTQEDEWQINNRDSRLGIKGSEDLGNGLKAVYKVELQLDFDGDEFDAGDGIRRTRNTYAGLAGNFGSVILGTHDTPLKLSTAALDYFDGTAAENNNGWTEAHSDRRAANTIAYITPSFSGLTVAGAIIPGEDSKGENDNPPAITGTEANGLADAYSIAAMYSNAGIHISIAHEFLDAETSTMAALAEDLVQTRVALGYTMASFSFNVIRETLEVDDVYDNSSLVVAGKYSIGNSHIAAKWFRVERNEETDRDTTGYAFKAGHSLSRRTSVNAVYLNSDMNDAGENTTLGFGLTHHF